MSESPSYLTSHEVADRLRVHVATVNRWAREGRIRHAKTPGGRTFRFLEADVADFLRFKQPEEVA